MCAWGDEQGPCDEENWEDGVGELLVVMKVE